MFTYIYAMAYCRNKIYIFIYKMKRKHCDFNAQTVRNDIHDIIVNESSTGPMLKMRNNFVFLHAFFYD